MNPNTPTDIVPDPRYWAPRRMTARQARRLIDTLDPVEHAAEIIHLSMEVLLPISWAHLGYVTAACRTCAVPRVAERIVRDGTGKQVRRPVQRDADTLTYFSAMMRRGQRSAAGRALARHVQDVHDAVGGIHPEDQLYTLATLILGPGRLAAAIGAHPPSATEDLARWHFWTGIGQGMGLSNIPPTLKDLETWAANYEHRLFEPNTICNAAAEAHINGLTDRFPGRTIDCARHVVASTLDPHTRACLLYPDPPVASRLGARAIASAARLSDPLRPVRLDATWASAFAATASPHLRGV